MQLKRLPLTAGAEPGGRSHRRYRQTITGGAENASVARLRCVVGGGLGFNAATAGLTYKYCSSIHGLRARGHMEGSITVECELVCVGTYTEYIRVMWSPDGEAALLDT